MRFVVMVKATAETEAGALPSAELLREMSAYNERLIQAGVLVSGEGLRSSAMGARVRFDGADRTVLDGPFAETKELVAGFWIFECPSLQTAIDWVKQCPNPTGDEGVIEIRQVFETEDFAEQFEPEVRAEAVEALTRVRTPG